jgi:hypothetical protein
VWEVVSSWKADEESCSLLRQNDSRLTDMQLRSALAYYRLYPADIDARLERERHWTAERVRDEMPYLAPLPADGTRAE